MRVICAEGVSLDKTHLSDILDCTEAMLNPLQRFLVVLVAMIRRLSTGRQ